MMPLDYYGRLLRRARAQAHAAPVTMADPFELTAPWLDEPPAVAEQPAKDAITIDRRTATPPLQQSPVSIPPPPEAPPAVVITPQALRTDHTPDARFEEPPATLSEAFSRRPEAGEDGNSDREPWSPKLVPTPLARVDESHAAPPPLTGDADPAAGGVVLAPRAQPDFAAPLPRSIDDEPHADPASVRRTISDRRAATRLMPAVPRLADVTTAPLDHVPPGDAIAPTVTIDHLDIEIESPAPPRRAPQELIDARRSAASVPADSAMTSRDLWRGPTDQAIGLGQV